MKICIFGASSAHIEDIYIKKVEDLAEKMARRGHSLVFGAGATGVMGAAARGTKRGGGYIHGIIPEFFREEGVEKIYTECDKLTYTASMAERKTLMEDDADAFIIAPGGIGEMSEKDFMAEVCHDMYRYFTGADELLDYLENYKPFETSWRRLKNTD